MRRLFRLSVGRRGVRRDVDAEIRFHLEMRARELIAAGMSPAEARAAAEAAFGDVDAVRAECLRIRTRRMRGRRAADLADALGQDLRFALRTFRRSPGFTLAVVVTLALGIGANTAIFSVIRGVLLRPLPYAEDASLLRLRQSVAGASDVGYSPVEIAEYADATGTLGTLVEYHSMPFYLLGGDEPLRVQTGIVSAEFFDVLGVELLHGRSFHPGEDEPGAEAVLVLSYEFWRDAFDADPGAVGRSFEMNGRNHRVVGVLPPLPPYPDRNDVYMPVSACPFRSGPFWLTRREARGLTVLTRARPGVAPKEAERELGAIGARLAAAHAEAYPAGSDFRTRVVPVKTELTRDARPRLLVLLGATGLLLLLACANVGNLELTRLLGRERELAMRAAVGAGRSRLVRQLVTETALLAVGGGALGWLLAVATRDLLVAFTARFTLRAPEVQLDSTVLLFTLGLSLATGVLVGLLPAWSASRRLTVHLPAAGASAGPGARRARHALIASQVAISLVLLIGAGLLMRSFLKLVRVDPGFDPERAVAAQIDLNWSKYDRAHGRGFARELERRLAAVPGIQQVAVANALPLSGAPPNLFRFRIEGREPAPGEPWPRGDYRSVSPGYFKAMGIAVVRGRTFREDDYDRGALVVVINESMAQRHWSGEDPVGQRVWPDDGEEAWHTVIGVVGDVRQYRLAESPTDEMYANFGHNPHRDLQVVVRSRLDPALVEANLREAVRALDPEQPVIYVRTLSDERRDSLAPSRVTLILLGLLAALALVITATGIAALVGHAVAARAREIGVRMALGAGRGAVRRMVVGQALAPVALGLAVGAAAALAVTPVLSGWLYGVGAGDPLTFLAGSALILAVAAAVSALPARRATAIDPALTLRSD